MAEPRSPICFSVAVGHTRLKLGHTHTSHEIYLCTGRPGVQVAADRTFAMRKGDLFLFPAGQPHHANAPEGSATDGLVLNFSELIFGRDREGDTDLLTLLGVLRERAWRGENRIGLSRVGIVRVGEILAEMASEHLGRAPGYRSAVTTGIRRFLLAILRDERVLPLVESAFRPTAPAERMAEVLRYVEYHYAEPLTVEQAAGIARLSRSRFHDVFRTETGTTFVEHLNAVRAGAAARMLRETDAAIIEVAYSCGFPSLSHFYHVFRRRLGRTPREVRLAASSVGVGDRD